MCSYWNDRYSPPDSWYEPDYETEYECSECDKRSNIIEQAGEFLAEIIKQLYSKEALNLIELENDLDELSHLLSVKMIHGDLKIERKEEPVIKAPISQFPTREEFISLNNNCLKLLAQ